MELYRCKASYPGRRKTHSPTRGHACPPPSQYIIRQVQPCPAKARPELTFQHVCDGVKYVLNKSQVFPQDPVRTILSAACSPKRAPARHRMFPSGNFSCTLLTRSWVPLWPQKSLVSVHATTHTSLELLHLPFCHLAPNQHEYKPRL
jgi:hypothetical protein